MIQAAMLFASALSFIAAAGMIWEDGWSWCAVDKLIIGALFLSIVMGCS